MLSEIDLRAALKNQHRTTLKMLEDVINAYSDELWTSDRFVNRSWRVSYHSLYFFRLYLHQKLEDHQAWKHHREGAEALSLDSDFQEMEAYSRKELLECINQLYPLIDSQLDTLDIDREDCGFSWYQISKFEHLMVNVKHLQQHVGQLQDRLRNHANLGIRWAK